MNHENIRTVESELTKDMQPTQLRFFYHLINNGKAKLSSDSDRIRALNQYANIALRYSEQSLIRATTQRFYGFEQAYFFERLEDTETIPETLNTREKEQLLDQLGWMSKMDLEYKVLRELINTLANLLPEYDIREMWAAVEDGGRVADRQDNVCITEKIQKLTEQLRG